MPIFETDDAKLFYEDAGRGEPVLLLHGLGGSTADWVPAGFKGFREQWNVTPG
jgi:pimeloyl-ACP methyl ester carboxylesterase